MKMPKRKLLVISHLAFNNTNNVGKTLYALFQGYKKDELIQLYFNSIPPNIDKCSSWFRIIDKEIIKSFFGKRAGSVHKFNEKPHIERNSSKIVAGSKTSFKLLIRDVLWFLGRVNKKGLNQWLDNNAPYAIFLAPGYNCFAYEFALKISKDRGIPIITFLMDDYYSEKKNNSALEKIRRFFLKTTIKKTIKHSRSVFACSKEMADDYSQIFNKQIKVLYTPLISEHYNNLILSSTQNTNIEVKVHDKDNKLVFLYAGSLGLGRFNILLKIGMILQIKYPSSILKVYASQDYITEIRELKRCPNIIYGGFLNADELHKEICKADVVLHVESFDEKLFTRIRYSISTKIPECLASNKMFLAIGPDGQAGIEYLKKNKASFVCTKDQKLEHTIDNVYSMMNYEEISKNSKSLLNMNHTAFRTREALEEALM